MSSVKRFAGSRRLHKLELFLYTRVCLETGPDSGAASEVASIRDLIPINPHKTGGTRSEERCRDWQWLWDAWEKVLQVTSVTGDGRSLHKSRVRHGRRWFRWFRGLTCMSSDCKSVPRGPLACEATKKCIEESPWSKISNKYITLHVVNVNQFLFLQIGGAVSVPSNANRSIVNCG